MQALPIDPVLPAITAALVEGRSLVLEAPPGAGKTTRVPRALLDAGMAEHGEILVLEPRRLAVRLAARRVADELGEPLGERVGYTVRFEEKASERTRIRFVTEGMLTRWLVRRPRLEGVAAVLLDEFHERHLQGDVAVALLKHAQATVRPDLRLVAMSATLDGARVAAYLGAPVIRAEGRRFDVDVRYLDKLDDRPLGAQIASAVRELARAGLDGHVLVFLPGAREIRAAHAACARVAEEMDLALHTLHGELSPEEQDAALAPSARRKIILSTNVAESSVTIEGIAAVIDSGLHRTLVASPWTGFASLRTEKISRASATQRAGRAGRTRAGVAVRLYTRADHDLRPEHDAPEIARVDLAETVLELLASGHDAARFDWLDAPPGPAIEAARTLLLRLGACDEAGAVTPLGKAMLRFPLHPRLSRAVLYADEHDAGEAACTMAAVLAERDVRREMLGSAGGRRGDGGEESDVLSRVELVERAVRERLDGGQLRARGMDVGAFFAVRRAAQQLVRSLPSSQQRRPPSREHPDEPLVLQKALLTAFPDRVARRRKPGSRELVLSSGGSVTQADESAVHEAPFVVVCGERGGDGTPLLGRLVSAIEPDWLLELFPARVRDESKRVFVTATERVESIDRLLYDELVLDESRGPAPADAETARVLATEAMARGLGAFVTDPEALERWLGRVRFVAALDPSFPRFDDAALALRMRALCEGRTRFAELRQANLPSELASSLLPAEAQRLREWAPPDWPLPSGRRAEVHYEPGKPPWLASRIQDLFGTQTTPVVGGGRAPVVIHLLAPSSRPVQITQDLAGFWKNHYPAVKRELVRKYPRHSWPDDPLHAAPEARPRPRAPR